MTIIFSKREDTEFLSNIWKNIPSINLIEISKNNFDKELINNALSKETDTIILCGHGTSQGLLTPDFDDLIVHQYNAHLLKDKTCICIWCYANEFMEKYDLHGFTTSMFISDEDEAYDNMCYDISSKYNGNVDIIQKENKLFAERINKLLINKVDISKWCDELKNQADMSIDFVEFNYNGLITR